jgi:hypothetical protein
MAELQIENLPEDFGLEETLSLLSVQEADLTKVNVGNGSA